MSKEARYACNANIYPDDKQSIMIPRSKLRSSSHMRFYRLLDARDMLQPVALDGQSWANRYLMSIIMRIYWAREKRIDLM